MAATRRTDGVLWWLCVALAFQPIVVVPFVADEVTGILIGACVVLAAIAVAFVLRRKWAWWVLVGLCAVAAGAEAANGADAAWWAVALNVAHLALLLTPPVRRRIFA